MTAVLNGAGITFTRPEGDKADPTTLDYYLPDLDLYIEVKQFHSDRIAKQLSAVPQMTSALVLVGPKSVEAFSVLASKLQPKDQQDR